MTRTQKAAFNARKIIFWTRLPVMNSQKLPGNSHFGALYAVDKVITKILLGTTSRFEQASLG